MIFVIDDDEIMAECVAKACSKRDVKIFDNAISAMDKISGGQLPDLIFMDVMLSGPDGFTFLNEMISYADTQKIPVVIVSEIDFSDKNLSEYGVVGTLVKERMVPEEIKEYAERYC